MQADDGRPFAGRKLHFIAIGGAGMSGIALVCHGLGAVVTGSDRSESTYVERLRAAGLDPLIGHSADQVPEDAEVVYSTAIPDDNVELALARERGQRTLHRSEMLAELTAAGRLIAVAGAHGKTTTAGMIAHALRATGAEPSFLLGGELPGAAPDGGPANAGWGTSGLIVAEADESDGSFLRLSPEVALVTNLELDHHSHWSGEGELRAAFRAFANSADRLVAPAGQLLEDLGGGTAFVVEDPGQPDPGPAAVRAGEPVPVEGGNEFQLTVDGETLAEPVRLQVPGRHNVANATSALAALHAAGEGGGLPPIEELAAALAGFPGMGRRLELKGRHRGALVYDDYAHHPTEVAATLAALRELPHRRLVAVFQPHLYSRTRALAGRFGRALAAADEIGILDVYPAREEPVGDLAGVSGLDVARPAAAAAGGRPVLWLRSMDAAHEHLAGRVGEGDILVTLGAGDVFQLAERLCEDG